jgi:hypothetical protein
MKDWAVSFMAAALLVVFVIYCVKVLVWAYAS